MKEQTAETRHFHKMIAMFNSLLSFFRLQSGKERMNIAPFRLQSIADALEAEFRPMAENKDFGTHCREQCRCYSHG
ncbi:HAMP domain-containing histidine kinase [Bacteroides uniformis]|jgi:sensor histidine kinase/response regulator|uniref:HAMP domain-containing histidine kinase n=1 Tax=Bacteroides uniformis TaxID=820 RepID=A0A7J5GTV8_BACUN|nr:HAMP domain-containing histidine kinase [Bacteroides uniformis]KAB4180987.1 HAMP domain-containing histidine kinase [Bacteroides uniformis]MUT98996.1 HAMP domain-containing histidine kinase [Bacteroides uniformis]